MRVFYGRPQGIPQPGSESSTTIPRANLPSDAVLDALKTILLAAPVLWFILLLKDSFGFGRF